MPAVAARPGRVALAMVVLDRSGNELIRCFNFQGERIKDLLPPSGRISALCLADDGSRLWVGTEQGLLEEIELPSGTLKPLRHFEAAVSRVFSTPGSLFGAVGHSIHVMPRNDQSQGLVLEMDRPIARMALSFDGRLLAACDALDGTIRAWQIDGDGASARALALDERTRGRTLSLAFSPSGDRLVSGDGDGTIRSWELPGGRARPAIPASRGRVRHIAISSDEKMLLQVSDDGIALVWDFSSGRGTRRIPGRFIPAGGFLPTGDLVMIDRSGDVVLHDRATLARRTVVFERPLAENSTRRSGWPFSTLTIDSSGRIAGASREGPLACVWNSTDGRLSLTRPIRDHQGGITAVSFSGDGRTLLTAGDDGLAKLWDVSGKEPRLQTRLWPGRCRSARQRLSRDSRGPVSGTRGTDRGGSTRWPGRGLESGAGQPSRVGRLDGHVRTLAFSADGKLLAAGGDDRQIALRAVNQLRPAHYPWRWSEALRDDQLAWSSGPAGGFWPVPAMTERFASGGWLDQSCWARCRRRAMAMTGLPLPLKDCSTPRPKASDGSPGGRIGRRGWATDRPRVWNNIETSDTSLT